MSDDKNEVIEASKEELKKASSSIVYFQNKVEIDLSKPLPHLDKGPVKAYSAEGKGRLQSNLFAYICTKSLTPRRITAQKFANVKNQNLVGFIDSGKVLMPDGSEGYSFIYHYSLGRKVLDGSEKKLALGKKPEDLLNNFVGTMIDLMEAIANKDFTHGEIWPGNMFYSGTGEDKIILGECLAVPTSYNLPALYEPVERALADPAGKGVGSIADDIYSFGVTLAVMLRNHAPEQGLSDEEIVERKIDRGSYSTLLENDRFNGATLEILRGLLYDDERQRWTLEDIRAWQDGRRLTPKQSSPRLKAIRPIVMNNKKYVRPEILAKDFIHHPIDAARLIESDDLSQWIERAIEDKSIRSRLEKTMKDAQNYDQGVDFSERLLVATSSVLFAEAPVMYRNLRFHPRGFGKYITAAYVDGKDIMPYVEVIRHYFTTFVIRAQKKTDASAVNTKFDAARSSMKQNKMHMGLERCFYLFNPETPCLSPLLEKYYAITPDDVVEALESVCKDEQPKQLLDRHILSFLFMKSKRNIEPFIMDITNDDPRQQVLGKLRAIATMQSRLRMGYLPNIGRWLAKNMDGVYERFHDDSKRNALKSRINKLAEKGDLTKIALIFEDPHVFENDLKEFYRAIDFYNKLDKEKKRIERRVKEEKTFGLRSGAQISSLLSLIIAACIIILTAYVMFLKGTF